MNILDYIILVLLVVCTAIGFFKGFIKQVLAIVGVFVVVTLTATVSPYVQNWLANVITNENTCAVLAMIGAALLITVVYSMLALLVRRLLKNIAIVKALDRVLGGFIGLALVYLVFAVIFALLNSTSETFMAATKNLLGDTFNNSWFGTHIYANNFFGDWIIKGIAEKILNSLQPAG